MAATGRPAGGRRLRRRPCGGRVVRRRGLRLSPAPSLTRFSGRVHRQTGLDTPAFPPDRPAAGEGRYHRAGDPWPLYASLEPMTVWAEWAAATRGAIDPADERRRLWSLEVEDLPVLDLRDPAVRDALGVDVEQLTGPRQGAQGLARRFAELGAEGAVVPSAAHAGHWNLVVLPAGFGRVRARRSRVLHPAPPAAA